MPSKAENEGLFTGTKYAFLKHVHGDEPVWAGTTLAYGAYYGRTGQQRYSKEGELVGDFAIGIPWEGER